MSVLKFSGPQLFKTVLLLILDKVSPKIIQIEHTMGSKQNRRFSKTHPLVFKGHLLVCANLVQPANFSLV